MRTGGWSYDVPWLRQLATKLWRLFMAEQAELP